MNDYILRTVFSLLVPAVIIGSIFVLVDSSQRHSRLARVTAAILLTAAALVLTPIALLLYLIGGIGAVLELLFLTGLWVIFPLLLLAGIGRVVESFTSIIDGGDEPPDAAPFYNIARLCRKRGDFESARQRIEDQLERFPTDYTGLMLLAEILAADCRDLEAASKVVDRIVAQDVHAAESKAAALFQLADWHLSQGAQPDPRAAQAVLLRIMELFPDSEFARDAYERLRTINVVVPDAG